MCVCVCVCVFSSHSFWTSSKEEKSPYPRFSTIRETGFIFFTKTIPCGTSVCTNWEPPYARKHPRSRRARTKLERVIAQIDRAVPLKVRACESTSEGSSAEVFMLGHARCRSNSSSEKTALAATPQIGGNPALDL